MKTAETHIVEAAIYHEGKTYTGRRHHEILKMMKELGESKPRYQSQGFVDNKGRFYDRTAAKVLAIRAGQLPEDHKGVMLSEDLW